LVVELPRRYEILFVDNPSGLCLDLVVDRLSGIANFAPFFRQFRFNDEMFYPRRFSRTVSE